MMKPESKPAAAKPGTRPKPCVWQIRLSAEEHAALLDLARRRGTTAAALVRGWLRHELDRKGR